uniref:3-hydroxyisobutyrate dehydrogenase-like NAD-binding domain-containing protein n=2 Tax=Corethron hystrix TaxID=216773 RepID=A0A7S1FW32_9STRA|mmetsp:Transcript_33127/g.76386  ORF Transcript_33127/g.76386 Transcript_33127/m.76386 type:complete len:148 (+) Transcript_33127:822-1265(+)
MCHQLLAGVHICAAAETLSLAAKAGVDPDQMYKVVSGAAGDSWMFQDRGKRMIETADPSTMMKLNDHVKDLANINQEAIELMCHTPLTSAALQQFVAAEALGLGTSDDSTVVKAYERISGVPVCNRDHELKDEKKNEWGGQSTTHLL